MRADPDNHKCRGLLRRFKEIDELKRSGDVSFREGCFEQAVAHWSACIALDPTTAAVAAKVLFNRGTAFSKLRQYEEAVKDFSAALELEPAYTKALIKRADCNHTLGTPESIERALGDYEKASQLVSDDEALAKELKQKLAQAKVSLKRSKRKDLYAILGVPRDAADDEVKRAYKKAALRFHPDKQAGKSEEEQAAATASFKGVSEAYEVLSDADKRRLYDDGVEVEEIDQHQEHGHQHSHGHGGMDPNEMFRMFMEQQRARGGGDW
jgi:DnaJ family protein C protein 7